MEKTEDESIELSTTSPKDKYHSKYRLTVLLQACLLCRPFFVIEGSTHPASNTMTLLKRKVHTR